MAPQVSGMNEKKSFSTRACTKSEPLPFFGAALKAPAVETNARQTRQQSQALRFPAGTGLAREEGRRGGSVSPRHRFSRASSAPAGVLR